MMALFEKYGEWLVAVIAIVAIAMMAWACYDTGYKSASAHYKVLMTEADKAHAEVYAAMEKSHRQQEKAHAAAIATLDKTHTVRLKYVQAKNKADMADLRSGALQLRARFICPDAGVAMSPTGTGTRLGDGTGGGGLRGADAEFLVSESDRADEVVIRLQMCQEIVRADRHLLTGI